MWSKSNNVTISNGEVPYQLLSQSCFYCPNLTAVAPLWLETKRFLTWLWTIDITTSRGRVPNGTLLIMFTCCPNLMFLAFWWLEYIDFQTGHFANFEQFKFGMIQSAGIMNWFAQSINRLQRFSLLFLFVAGFSDMHDKNKDTKSFTELGEYLLNGYFLTILSRAIFRTQSKVFGGAFLQK